LSHGVICHCGLSLYGRYQAHETDHQNCATSRRFLHSIFLFIRQPIKNPPCCHGGF
jgi:hypothetical protein